MLSRRKLSSPPDLHVAADRIFREGEQTDSSRFGAMKKKVENSPYSLTVGPKEY